MDSIVLFVYLYLDAQSASADFGGTHEMYLPKKKYKKKKNRRENQLLVYQSG